MLKILDAHYISVLFFRSANHTSTETNVCMPTGKSKSGFVIIETNKGLLSFTSHLVFRCPVHVAHVVE